MLRYEKTNLNTGRSEVVNVPLNEALNESTSFLKGSYNYILLQSEMCKYLVHRYAKHLHFTIHDSVTETYSELYDRNPNELITLITKSKLQSKLEKDIEGMYKMYNEMEQRMKEYDDYVNGHLNY